MLLFVESMLWSIIGESGFVVSSVVPSAQALLSLHMPTGKLGSRPVGVYMGYVSGGDHALLDFRLSLPEEWARDAHRRQECHVPAAVQYRPRQEQCLEMLDLWGEQVGFPGTSEKFRTLDRYRLCE